MTARLTLVSFVALGLCACASPRATRQDCERILARIVTIELTEQGYRDPVLLERKQAEMADHFAADVGTCVGRRLPADALPCIERASDTETLTHMCLRR